MRCCAMLVCIDANTGANTQVNDMAAPRALGRSALSQHRRAHTREKPSFFDKKEIARR